MGWNTTKIDAADKWFSLYVRNKAAWKCEYCGKPAEGQGLHAAHFHGRRKESVRYDLENVNALCALCHKHFTNHYNEHKEWKLKQLGQKKYDLLNLRANTPQKKDRKLQAMYWKAKVKELHGKAL